jgi:hypothetical protein
MSKSTQPWPQLNSPGSQPVPLQRPDWQVSPALQLIPQAPQLATSVCGLMQRPPHDKSPLLQLHLPAEHRCRLLQEMSQSPQCEELESRLTQAPRQLVSPFEHSSTHLPASQDSVSPQARVQEPQ